MEIDEGLEVCSVMGFHLNQRTSGLTSKELRTDIERMNEGYEPEYNVTKIDIILPSFFVHNNLEKPSV